MHSLTDARTCATSPAPSQAISVTCHGNDEQYRCKRATDSDGIGAEVVRVSGLVHSQTSGTPPSGPIRVDGHEARLKRLKHTVLTSARLHAQETQPAKGFRAAWKCAFLTTTYRPGVEWEPGHISNLVRHIRQYLARKGIAMRQVWVMEFTKKGVPHYHMLVWLPKGISLPMPDKRGWWPHGSTNIKWARKPAGYLAKYASKGDSLVQPAKGARMHGNGGLTGDALLEQRWWKLPGWVREDHGVQPSDRVKRAATGTGGGFLHPDTGEVYRSPYEVFFKGGWVYIQRRKEA